MTSPDGGNAGTRPTGPAGSGPGRSIFAALDALLSPGDIAAIERDAAADPPLTADQRAILLALLKPAAPRTRLRAA